ncbi:hypothetical protein [Methylomicrobium lacus]|uniref:hypothetical protein n=1 Tax=Methylomicrobium lacus TaxID=136992 RepID=UPI0035A8D4DC
MSNLNNRDCFKRYFLGFAVSIGIALGCTNFALADDGGDFEKYYDKGVNGRIYEVEVKNYYGKKFKDCYEFDKYSPGYVKSHRLGHTFKYAHAYMNSDERTWIASGTSDYDYGYSMYGTSKDDGHSMDGYGFDEYGTSYEYSGKENKDCHVDYDESYYRKPN